MKNNRKLNKSWRNPRKYAKIAENIRVQEGSADRKILIKFAEIRADEASKGGVLPQNQAPSAETLARKEPHNCKLPARTLKTVPLQLKARPRT